MLKKNQDQTVGRAFCLEKNVKFCRLIFIEKKDKMLYYYYANYFKNFVRKIFF